MRKEDRLVKGLRKDSGGFSLVWIAPILALIITAGMLYKTYSDAGTRITIIVDTGDGIQDKKTPIMYKGIKIGVVDDIHIHEKDVSKLELEAIIDKEAAWGVTREGNKFWIVKPKVSLTEVSGLDTIISGVYIAVMPAKNTKDELYALPYQDTFTALNTAPVNVFDPGLLVHVSTQNKGDIAVGAPVLYNKQAIGKVENKRLSEDKKEIVLDLRIQSQYVDLVHVDSQFYKANALDIKAGLSGIKINVGSFASLIAGGIALHNAPEALKSAQAKQDSHFDLYDNFEELMLHKDEIVLKMNQHETVQAGVTKIYFKGVEAGLVKEIAYDAQKNESVLKVRLHQDFRAFANERAYFWIVKAQLGFDKVEGLDTVVRGNYINFISNDITAKKASDFVLHADAPAAVGKAIKLLSSDIQSLKKGAGVFYHNIEVGQLNGYTLNSDKKSFTLDVIIYPKYTNLLNGSTRFYHNNGVSFKASLHKISVSTGSLETMLRGGITMETPRFKQVKKAKSRYHLYQDHETMLKASYLAQKGLYLNLEATKAGSIKPGSAVLFRQIPVGEVLSRKWDAKKRKFIITLFIIKEFANEVYENTLFYNASGIHAKLDFNGLDINTESLETIVTGGIAFFTPSELKGKQAKKFSTYHLYENRDKALNSTFNINLLAKTSAGLKAGSTLRYKDVVIGYIDAIDLEDKQVKFKARIMSKYAELINADTLFWVERFSLGLSGIKNPSSALTGSSIHIKAGASKEHKKVYPLSLKAPLPHFQEEGLRVSLKSARLGGIKASTPLYFRQVKIGSVTQYALNADATAVDIELFIEPCYAHIIRKNSYFFNASGIGMDISLFGAKVKTETLESIITGGIGVLTPDDFEAEAAEQDSFILHEDFDEDALEWAPQLISSKESCNKV